MTTFKSDKKCIDFFDKRYADNYMDDWPSWEKNRISEIIKGLNLPQRGTALDFGCGNGIFSAVIKKTLPGWDVFGTDISANAINNAKKRFSECYFYRLLDKKNEKKKFDFIFTHHVLEHVSNISKVWKQLDKLSNKKASLLHILPCGNKGSFEYKICALRKNGINKRNGRFFFEDSDHLRRMNSEQMNKIAKSYGFHLEKEFYSDGFYTDVLFLAAQSHSFILNFTDSSKLRNKADEKTLNVLRTQLLITSFIIKNKFSVDKLNFRKRNILKIAKTIMLIPVSLILTIIDQYIKKKAVEEWEKKNKIKTGSVMYLYYIRN